VQGEPLLSRPEAEKELRAYISAVKAGAGA